MSRNILRGIVLLAILVTWSGCKSIGGPVSFANYDIIGSWEGCDGRVVTFSKVGNGGIEGQYTKLGGLDRYKFTVNEVGFYLVETQSGTYTGRVKWKNTMGEETWRGETIVVENNILKTSSSDDCSTEMARLKL